MKITLCGSLSFAKEMLEVQKELEKLGHDVLMPKSVVPCVGGKKLSEDFQYCIENNVIKEHFKKILESDAILVLNMEKNGIKHYIGGSALMEIGFAHFNDKKIFLMNPIPELKYGFEISLTNPVILNEDLSKIET